MVIKNMDKIIIKKESLAKRCDICHQNDQFDAVIKVCKRCKSLNLEKKEILPRNRKVLRKVLFSGLRAISFIVVTISGLINLLFIVWLSTGGRYSIADGDGMACGSIFYKKEMLFSSLLYFAGFLCLFLISAKGFLFSSNQLKQKF